MNKLNPNRRKLIAWIPPSVAAITLPMHAQASMDPPPPPPPPPVECDDPAVTGSLNLAEQSIVFNAQEGENANGQGEATFEITNTSAYPVSVVADVVAPVVATGSLTATVDASASLEPGATGALVVLFSYNTALVCENESIDSATLSVTLTSTDEDCSGETVLDGVVNFELNCEPIICDDPAVTGSLDTDQISIELSTADYDGGVDETLFTTATFNVTNTSNYPVEVAATIGLPVAGNGVISADLSVSPNTLQPGESSQGTIDITFDVNLACLNEFVDPVPLNVELTSTDPNCAGSLALSATVNFELVCTLA